MKILLLQGANMVALGRREPELYGTVTAGEADCMVTGMGVHSCILGLAATRQILEH